MRRIEYIGYILLAFYCIFFTGCKKDENPRETRIAGVLDDAVPSRKSAIVSGSFSGSVSGIQQFGFLYSLSADLNPSLQTTLKLPISESFSTGRTYTVTLPDLEPGKTYYYCLYVSNGTHIMKTEASKFTTFATLEATLGEMRLDEAGEYSLSLSSSILDDGGTEITQCGFRYKAHKVEGEFNIKEANPTLFKATIEGLSPGVEYDVYPFATNQKGTVRGDTLQFVTQGFEAPVVKTKEVTEGLFGSDWAQLSGSVENKGSTDVVSAGFCYTTDNKIPTEIDNPSVVTDMKNLSFKLTNLKSGTIYTVRAFAKNATKTGYGNTIKFQTLEYVKPICDLPKIGDVTDTSVKLEATVQVGSDEVLKMGFCYSEGAPTIETGIVAEVGQLEMGALKTTITGLKPNKEYIVCAFVQNKKEVVYSKPQKMKTSADPIPTIGELIFSNIQKTSFTVQAKVSSAVSITKQVFLYSSTNPMPRLGGNDVKDVSFSSSAIINDVTPNTRYYVCAYVLNEAGKETYSSVATVTTTAMVLPVVSNVNVQREGTTAKITASYTSESSVTECGICYSKTEQLPSIETSTKGIVSGNQISGQLTALEAGSTYYIRVYAKSLAGIGYSETTRLVIGSNKPGIDDNDSPDKN